MSQMCAGACYVFRPSALRGTLCPAIILRHSGSTLTWRQCGKCGQEFKTKAELQCHQFSMHG